MFRVLEAGFGLSAYAASDRRGVGRGRVCQRLESKARKRQAQVDFEHDAELDFEE